MPSTARPRPFVLVPNEWRGHDYPAMVRRAALLRTTTLHGFPGSEASAACSQLAAVLPRWSSVEHGNARQLFERYLAAARHLAEEATTPL